MIKTLTLNTEFSRNVFKKIRFYLQERIEINLKLFETFYFPKNNFSKVISITRSRDVEMTENEK